MMKKLVMLSMIFLLSSCSPVKLEPMNTYELNKLPAPIVKNTKKEITILVTMPEIDPVYNTNQIAYTLKPYEISYYSKNTWAATPAQMLQPLIIQSLLNTHHYIVISSASMAHYDFLLNTQILKLQQEFDCHCCSVVRMTLRAELIGVLSNQVRATKQFSVVVPVCGIAPYCAVIAANQASAEILYQLTRFCLKVL